MDGYICNERSYRDLKRLEKIQQQSLKKSSQQTIEQNVVFLRTLEFRLVSPVCQNRFAMRWIKGGKL